MIPPNERGDCDCEWNDGAICPECFNYYGATQETDPE